MSSSTSSTNESSLSFLSLSSSWFRSEPMEYISLVMNEDAAYECLVKVGKLGAIQFTDLNSDLTPFKRRYLKYVQRCDELERKIQFISQEIISLGIDMNKNDAVDSSAMVEGGTSTLETNNEIGTTTNQDVITDSGIMLSPMSGNSTSNASNTTPIRSNTSQHPAIADAATATDHMSPPPTIHDVDDLQPILQKHTSHIEELNTAYQILANEYNRKIEYHSVLETLRRIYFVNNDEDDASSPSGDNGINHQSSTDQNDTESQLELASIMTGGGNSSTYGDDSVVPDNDLSAPLLENQYEIGTDFASNEGSVSAETNHIQQLQRQRQQIDPRLRFSSIIGVVDTSERVRFERMIFRATRGNTFVRFFPLHQTLLESSNTTGTASNPHNLLMKKSVFIIFFRSELIERKLKNICDAFGANRYNTPNLQHQETYFRSSDISLSPLENLNESLTDVATEIRDCKVVLKRNYETKYKLCQLLANYIHKWKNIVLQEKAVYHTMNKFQTITSSIFGDDEYAFSSSFGVGSGNVILRGEGWALSNQVAQIRQVVEIAHNSHHHHHRPHGSDINGGSHRYVPSNGSLESNITTTDSDTTAANDNGDNTSSLVSQIPRSAWPEPIPTHFVSNGFTHGYQEFVNTYGVPRYREANPALFTAVTFPFLFGIMYGDIGHGLILFLFGCYQILLHHHRKSKNDTSNSTDEIGQFLSDTRYMITMMGFFAIYAGFIYNDCFALSLNLFGSRWTFQRQADQGDNESEHVIEEGTIASLRANYTYGSSDSVYPFGLDPIWSISENELDFTNSFKMKFSVIVGIAQMILGLILKASNAIQFENHLDLYCMFLPMMVFTSCLFVYMVLLILIKWSINWNRRMLLATCFDPINDPSWNNTLLYDVWKLCDQSIGDGTCTPWGHSCARNDTTAIKCPFDFGGSGDGCQPPNLVNTLILMVLQPGSVDEPMFRGQHWLQVLLVLIAFLSIPTLLCSKPWILYKQRKERLEQRQSSSMMSPLLESTEDTPISNRSDLHQSQAHVNDDNEEDFSEILIHQAIETIEFVLGMVSNTASYLRLWALSLAHFELATVLWDLTIKPALKHGSPISLYLGFGIYCAFTTGILLFMDVLECCLHALRLHWVEFQNKFFHGDGKRFTPYSLQEVSSEGSSSM